MNSITYPFPKVPLSIIYDILDIIYDTSDQNVYISLYNYVSLGHPIPYYAWGDT